MRPRRNAPPFRPVLLFALVLAATFVPAHSEAAETASFGPLYERYKLTLDLGERTEAVSPFYYRQTSGEPGDLKYLWAIPPLFSYGKNEGPDTEYYDVLWKVLAYSRYGTEYRWHFVQVLSFAGGQTQSETNVSRFTLFPIYFQQRSPQPEKNYTGLLPIYGTLKERLFRDEIHWVMFPIYGQTRKRDVVTDNWLFPIFHLRHGDGLTGWQVWPLLGLEHKEVTQRTNRWEELEVIGGHSKSFVLWPIFQNEHGGIGTTNEFRQQGLLPFYTYYRSPGHDSTTYFWPLGATHTVEREKKYNSWGTPWPFIVFARGEGKTISRVWPFYSQAHNASQTSDWYLWPVYKYNRLHAAPLDRQRTRICFFVYSDVKVKNTDSGELRHQVDFWPFYTFHRETDGRSRLQVLALLEPYLANNDSVERDLSPLWSIWRSEQNPKTGAHSQSLLWNLYRHESRPDTKKCSLLFGLFQYQSGPDVRRWRVFYIPFGGPKSSGSADAR